MRGAVKVAAQRLVVPAVAFFAGWAFCASFASRGAPYIRPRTSEQIQEKLRTSASANASVVHEEHVTESASLQTQYFHSFYSISNVELCVRGGVEVGVVESNWLEAQLPLTPSPLLCPLLAFFRATESLF